MSEKSTMMVDGATAALEEALKELKLNGNANSSKRLRTGDAKDTYSAIPTYVPALPKTEPFARPSQALTADFIKTLIPPQGVPTAVLSRQLGLFKNDIPRVAGLVAQVAVMKDNMLYPKNQSPAPAAYSPRLMNRVMAPLGMSQLLANLRKENIELKACIAVLKQDRKEDREAIDAIIGSNASLRAEIAKLTAAQARPKSDGLPEIDTTQS